jgi:DNA primase
LIQWQENGNITLLKVRHPDWSYTKYEEVYRCGPTVYPGIGIMYPDRPLIVCEGEFDTLLLIQEAGRLAGVVTTGSASNHPTRSILDTAAKASKILVATDNDDAGERAAAVWLQSSGRAVRIRPPSGKDWTEARAAGVDLKTFWGKVIAG